MKPGHIIPIKKEHELFLKSFTDKMDAANTLMLTAGAIKNDTRKQIVDFFNEVYPELEGYDFSYEPEKKVLLITRRKVENI